jgi:hypothetical protein
MGRCLTATPNPNILIIRRIMVITDHFKFVKPSEYFILIAQPISKSPDIDKISQ